MRINKNFIGIENIYKRK